jgi:hypothetical protein
MAEAERPVGELMRENPPRRGSAGPRTARSQRALAAGQCVAELATHSVRAERLGASDAGGIEHERGAQPRGELCDSPERIGVLDRALELGVNDGVRMLGLMAPGVAHGPLASVQPAP